MSYTCGVGYMSAVKCNKKFSRLLKSGILTCTYFVMGVAPRFILFRIVNVLIPLVLRMNNGIGYAQALVTTFGDRCCDYSALNTPFINYGNAFVGAALSEKLPPFLEG